MPLDPEEVSAVVFAALADPTRRAILASLARHGPSTATDLSGRLSITRQGVAKHLALLADAGQVGLRHLDRRRAVPVEHPSAAAGVAGHQARVGEQRQVLGDALPSDRQSR